MTRLYGFTRSNVLGNVIGIGKCCICWKVYFGKATRKFGGWFYLHPSDKVIWQLKYNNSKFNFFGFMHVISDDLMDTE